MSDVNALIGKMRANVAYRQFQPEAAPETPAWPVLERIARAQAAGQDGPLVRQATQVTTASGQEPAEPPQPQGGPALAERTKPAAEIEGVAEAATRPTLRRQAPPSLAASPPQTAFALSGRAPAPAAEPAMAASAPRPLRLQRSGQGAGDGALASSPQSPASPQPSGGLLLQRYAPVSQGAGPAGAAASGKALADIFARLGRKAP